MLALLIFPPWGTVLALLRGNDAAIRIGNVMMWLVVRKAKSKFSTCFFLKVLKTGLSCNFIFFFLNVYLFLREREGDRGPEAGSMLTTESLMQGSNPWAGISCLTHWATQEPLNCNSEARDANWWSIGHIWLPHRISHRLLLLLGSTCSHRQGII